MSPFLRIIVHIIIMKALCWGPFPVRSSWTPRRSDIFKSIIYSSLIWMRKCTSNYPCLQTTFIKINNNFHAIMVSSNLYSSIAFQVDKFINICTSFKLKFTYFWRSTTDWHNTSIKLKSNIGLQWEFKGNRCARHLVVNEIGKRISQTYSKRICISFLLTTYPYAQND